MYLINLFSKLENKTKQKTQTKPCNLMLQTVLLHF